MMVLTRIGWEICFLQQSANKIAKNKLRIVPADGRGLVDIPMQLLLICLAVYLFKSSATNARGIHTRKFLSRPLQILS
jgi:hypothetical protein